MPWEGPSIPKDPPNYSPEDKFADPVLYFQHREAVTAEEFVRVAEAKVRCHPALSDAHMDACRRQTF